MFDGYDSHDDDTRDRDRDGIYDWRWGDESRERDERDRDDGAVRQQTSAALQKAAERLEAGKTFTFASQIPHHGKGDAGGESGKPLSD
jgi:hypothetical protein